MSRNDISTVLLLLISAFAVCGFVNLYPQATVVGNCVVIILAGFAFDSIKMSFRLRLFYYNAFIWLSFFLILRDPQSYICLIFFFILRFKMYIFEKEEKEEKPSKPVKPEKKFVIEYIDPRTNLYDIFFVLMDCEGDNLPHGKEYFADSHEIMFEELESLKNHNVHDLVYDYKKVKNALIQGEVSNEEQLTKLVMAIRMLLTIRRYLCVCVKNFQGAKHLLE